MKIPSATYRFQFSEKFTFSDAEKTIPYLSSLGISHVYASPIMKAVSRSTHGYDVVSPDKINPELGGEEGFRKLRKKLDENGIGWIQDFVPNHMAFSTENIYLYDILEKGRSSQYSNLFDIDWDSPFFRGKIVCPILADDYDREIGKIRVIKSGTKYKIRYYDNTLPVSEQSARLIEEILKGGAVNSPDELPSSEAETEVELNYDLKREILDSQNYILRNWRSTNHEINYRRFFNVNGLITINSMNTENIHFISGKLYDLIGEGLIDGVRLDHIDGIYDPYRYLMELRRRFPDLIVIVEKVLSYKEPINQKWPIEGTTGYDFLFLCNALQSDREDSVAMNKIYGSLVSTARSPDEIVRESKEGMLDRELYGDLINITSQIYADIKMRDYGHDITFKSLFRTIREYIIQMPVYRTYLRKGRQWERDMDVIRSTLRRSALHLGPRETCFEAFGKYLTEYDTIGEKDPRIRMQQYEPAFYAKSIEDRLFYVHNPLISRNEVGNDPYVDYISPDEFHESIQIRMSQIPDSMNLTSTHDTKFGEDLRARINAIQDNPELWNYYVRRWMRMNSRFLRVYHGVRCPVENQEYLIYQVLAGSPPGCFADDEYVQRLHEYLRKIIREGGRTTEWYEPDLEYESNFMTFLTEILDNARNQQFLSDIESFQRSISIPGYLNSLSQTVLKLTVPGFPDIYRGSEGWDFSFVDPDNRRPVDHENLMEKLSSLPHKYDLDSFSKSLADIDFPYLKLYIIEKLLNLRKIMPDLFRLGSYIPVIPSGLRSDDTLIYARRYGGNAIIVIIPLHTGGILQNEHGDFQQLWDDMRLDFGDLGGLYHSLISGREVRIPGKIMYLHELMGGFPMDILLGKTEEGMPSE